MSHEDPVTIWLDRLRDLDEAAASKLWHHYCQRLLLLARQRIPAGIRAVYDEEDAAVSAFHSLCRGMREGRFDSLADRDELWRLLVVITSRKIIRRHKHEGRQKRGGSSPPISMFANQSDTAVVEGVVCREPTPEFATATSETCDFLLDKLPDNSVRTVATRRLEGYTNREIAEELNVGLRSVERKLKLIREIWKTQIDDED